MFCVLCDVSNPPNPKQTQWKLCESLSNERMKDTFKGIKWRMRKKVSERRRLKFTYTHTTCFKICTRIKKACERGKTIFSIEIRDLFCPSFLNPAFFLFRLQ